VADNKIVIEVSGTGNAEVVINGVTKATKELATQGAASLDKFSGAFNSFIGNVGAGAVIGAFNKLTSAASALFDTFVVDGVSAAIEQEDALNKLSFALKQAGDTSAAAVSDFDAFASAIQATTKFQDDAVISAGALLSSLSGLTGQGLKDATQAAVNLSAVLGKDLDTVSLALAKGFQGSTEGLKKFGIVLDDSKPKAEALADALAKINAGGAASAQVNTFSGAVALAKNNLGELGETIGGAIISNQALINVIKAANDIFILLNEKLKANRQSFSDFVTNGIIIVIDGLSQLTSFAQAAVVTFLKVQQAVVVAGGLISAFAHTVTLGLTDAGKRALESGERFEELDRQIAELEDSKGVAALQEGLFKLKAAAEAGLGAVATNASDAERNINGATNATKALTEEQKKLIEETKKQAESVVAKADPQKDLDNKIALQQQALEIDRNNDALRLEAIAAFEQQKFDIVAAKSKETADVLIAQNQALIQDGAAKNSEEIAMNDAALAALLESNTLTSRDIVAIKKAQTDQERVLEQQKNAAIQTGLGGLAAFQNAKTKELAVVGKAAAIAQATINTFQGASLALATVPFPFGFLAAAGVVSAGLVQVANITGTNLATGITEVPQGFRNDTFRANLSSGERVVDANTNQDLKLFLATNNNNTQLLSSILNRLDSLERTTVVNIGGREIVNEVQRQIDSGRALNV
jgi:hypothetical protein